MVQSVFTAGIVITVIMIILGFILGRAKLNPFALYIPFLALFVIGLLFLLFATILERTWLMGITLGGWGLACVFSAAISFITTALVDTFAHHN